MEQDMKKSIPMVLVAIILAAALIVSTNIATKGLVEVKGVNSITVTGSAKQQIKSDLIVWQGNFSYQSPSMTEAYAKLSDSLAKVKKYLKAKGIAEDKIVISSINSNPVYEILPNGQYSNIIIAYRLDQRVEISSNEVDKITAISREATELINEGVEFQSYQPQYYYTKIADLKVTMLAQATKDAKNRATQIAENTDSQIGSLKSAKMGVFQITPLYSTDVADYGINDTSSIDKEITAVVTCSFELK